MAHNADPGGVFASDTHRRVLAHLPPDVPYHVPDLFDRIAPDHHTPLVTDTDLQDVLEDLEADGHVQNTDAGWTVTPAGLDALTGPNNEEAE